jgi:M6 family metalloprotease-like protein
LALLTGPAVAFATAQVGVVAQDPRRPRKPPDPKDYRTVEQALTTQIRPAASAEARQPGYLGIHVPPDAPRDRLRIAEIEPGSPAERAGLQVGDVLRQVAGQTPANYAGLRELLQSRAPGETATVVVLRGDKLVHVSVTFGATSRPLVSGESRPILGIQVEETADGLRVDQVTADSPAAAAGLRVGDLLTRIDGQPVGSRDQLVGSLGGRRPGDVVTVVLRRGGQEREVRIRLAANPAAGRQLVPWNDRDTQLFRGSVYHLAVVPIEYPDVKHNARLRPRDWAQALFSTGTYTDRSPTGQQVYGSLNDYYREQSANAFRITGHVFEYVPVTRKRAEYNSPVNRYALFTEALDRLLARDGAEVLKEFDGLCFIYAGDRFPARRGELYWPHRGLLSHGGRHWSYFICPEGGERMASISVFAHEFGHMLGLPDLYARPEDAGGEGLGVWCTMSHGHGRDGKPLHLSAWCKERLGWLRPAVLDPRVRQKLQLAPIEGTADQCFKVLIQPDGSEYLLLENRAARGFDRDLPGEGLLIWRVVKGRPLLEEATGGVGPDGPRRYLGAVPYPSPANTAFTPYTTPSSKPRGGDGWPVHLTNIYRLPDGRVLFHIGWEYL